MVGVIAWLLKDAMLFAADGKILLVLKSLGIGVVSVLVFFGGSYLLRLKEITDVVGGRKRK